MTAPPASTSQLKLIDCAGRVQATHNHARWAFQVAALWRLAFAWKGLIELTALPRVGKPVSP